MSRYLARIVGPSGMERFLARGREVALENATLYAHPSAARAASAAYIASHPGCALCADVLDTRDYERVIV